MLNAGHLAKGDNLRTVRPEFRQSAHGALVMLQRIEYDESYWRRMMEQNPPKDDDDKPRR